jgi:branched-chain amino acid transport system permease protein
MLAQLLLSGIALGSIYALLALALVLIHKATDVINFAQGEMATLTTFIAYVLLSRFHLPLPFVFVISFGVGALIGGVVQRVFIHPLAKAPPINILIVTIGLWIVFNNLVGWIWGFDPLRFPSLLPTESVDISGLRISPNSLATIGVGLGLTALLFIFFEYTREGTAMRAASMNRWAAQLMGIRVTRTATISWALATGIAALAGLLIAPTTFLDFQMMVHVLLKAFASAILGGFNSLPGAILGGLTIGVLENLFGAYVSTAFKDSFSLLVIVAVLMFRPSGLFSRKQVKKV